MNDLRTAAQAALEAMRNIAAEYEDENLDTAIIGLEAALAELEGIVSSMEGGQVPLKESLEAYRRGAVLLKYCQATLKGAQLEIEVLEKGVLKAFKPEDGDE